MIDIIKKYGITAKKSLGQNYLINEEVLEKIVKSVEISDKNILEIGPGYGALTEKIIEKNPKNLTLVELDQKMIDVLNDRISSKELDISKISEFKMINIDILKYEPEFKNYVIIANIPYYITSPILYKFLYEVKNKPTEMIIMMQKDVAEKILNPKKSSYLSLYIQKKCKVKSIVKVPRKDFFPAPKVDSEILKFMLYDNLSKNDNKLSINNKYLSINDNFFIKICKIGFKNPRKKLINNFVTGGFDKTEILKIFEKLGIDENVRGEDLGIEVWCKLAEKLF